MRTLRKEHKITQAQLAAILNLDASTISKYEKADVTPSTDILLKMAELFNVPTDYLLGVDAKKASTLEEVDAKELQLLKDLVDQLTPDQQQELLRYGQYLASQPPFSKEG